MPSSKLARGAAILTLVLIGLTILQAVASRQFLSLIPIPIFAFGAIGMLKGRAWSAYGLALYQAAQLFVVWIARFHTAPLAPSAEQIGSMVLVAALGTLYFLTGRQLAAAGGKHGYATPWIVLAVLVAAPFLFVEPFIIPTGSMEDTLLVGDYILVKRWPQVAPHRGDIVAYRHGDEFLVKRIVGMPGDRIKVVRKQLYINGSASTESYAVYKTDYVDPYRDNFPSAPNVRIEQPALDMLQNHLTEGQVVVPQGDYFVLGDNRDASFDSRYTGFVPATDVIGKPLMIYWSAERPADGKGPAGPIRWDRIFKLL